MSTHPNVILMIALSPHDLARKTLAAIVAASDPPSYNSEDQVSIGGEDYRYRVMEVNYYDEQQIAAKEGDLVFWDLVTYGYGEKIAWKRLAEKVEGLDAWAKKMCEEFHCDYEISVGANYW